MSFYMSIMEESLDSEPESHMVLHLLKTKVHQKLREVKQFYNLNDISHIGMQDLILIYCYNMQCRYTDNRATDELTNLIILALLFLHIIIW